MPTSIIEPARGTTPAAGHLRRPSVAVIAALFAGYLAVGLPLPVMPLFVHDKLGFSNVIVGLVIGIQFLATVLTRGYAGAVADRKGGKRAALQGAAFCALGGLLYGAAALPALTPAASLAIIATGRLAAGFGESQFVTGCVSWSIASVGAQRAGLSMSWTGIAMFAALAIGAPAGMALYQQWGFQTAMAACAAAPAVAAAIAVAARPYHAAGGQRLPFRRVIAQIWREGLGLMLQGVGLAGLTAFASLYFAARHWGNAGLVMTAFGIGFIAVRLVAGHLPDKIGGYRVALCSLAIEAGGQLMVWAATQEAMALAGALVTGLGCALIFPALGVEALKRVPPANRGSAMGAFVAFLDIAYGVSGPLAGMIAARAGYAAVYLCGAACAALGGALVFAASRQQH
ncbi:arabinose transporter [Cupriavidus plantarum]|uniref:arabinose transporter n=1 Tax=Cupriavidus plantarum TaxID=942865 RepID=UPI000EB15DB2|nr:arabinose transporter [Cupriavidus plantarum]RLK31840.1 putative MFS family arabinose efflux permease [Cupriavidus plantarum]